MADKIRIDGDFDGLEYEPSDSEEDYTQEEKNLLKKVRNRGKTKNVQQEILAFDDDESDDDVDNDLDQDDEDDNDILNDSDIQDDDNNDGIPDSRAWGKKRSAYYFTDFVDQDYSTYNQKDEELALQEEEEAKAIQQRLAKQLDECDFSLDIYTDLVTDTVNEDHQQEIVKSPFKSKIDSKNLEVKLKTDIENLSKRQKQQLFQKDSPEFFGLMQDFEKYLEESQKFLQPFLNYMKTVDTKSPTIQFAETMNNVILTYCTNIAFYLTLKTKRISIKNHPIVKRLVQIRQVLQQLEEKYNDVIKAEIIKVIQIVESGLQPIFKESNQSTLMSKSAIKKSKKKLKEQFKDDEDMEIVANSADESGNDDDDEVVTPAIEDDDKEEDEIEGDERREITYQIAKNKGLTPHRKKEFRNPRVKNRSKYRKALIRRKGAVRTVRKEFKRYGGEISGIKSTVKKSIKIKS